MWGRLFWRSIAAGASGALCLSWSPPASAYCRTMSCELGETEASPCAEDAGGCVTEGTPLHWPSPCLTYAVQVDGSPKSGLEADQVLELVREAFAVWRTATCPGGGNPSFEATFQGFVGCHQRESVCGGIDENVNVVMFYDENWPGRAGELALTMPAGSAKSGLIVDADMEFNAQNFAFEEGASDPNAVALFYVMAHEVGHFLGLGHSKVARALMGANYVSMPMSSSLLTEDDVAAICAAYPPSNTALSCSAGLPAYDACQLPTRGHEKTCDISSKPEAGGCSLARAGTTGTPPAALALALAALLRRRRGHAVAAKARACR